MSGCGWHCARLAEMFFPPGLRDPRAADPLIVADPLTVQRSVATDSATTWCGPLRQVWGAAASKLGQRGGFTRAAPAQGDSGKSLSGPMAPRRRPHRQQTQAPPSGPAARRASRQQTTATRCAGPTAEDPLPSQARASGALPPGLQCSTARGTCAPLATLMDAVWALLGLRMGLCFHSGVPPLQQHHTGHQAVRCSA